MTFENQHAFRIIKIRQNDFVNNNEIYESIRKNFTDINWLDVKVLIIHNYIQGVPYFLPDRFSIVSW